jgi:hypothetical protein
MATSNPTPKVAPITCPNCGGSVTLRGYGQSLSVVCIQCLSILDMRTDTVQVLQQFQAKERIRPAIPLGTRGKFEGSTFEAIGFQVREITVDDVVYSWREFLLFNPYKGYRYLSEYDGHWNFIRTAGGLPEISQVAGRPAAKYRDKVFKHFQTSTARTAYVMGEFPWQVQVGETVEVADFIDPPRMLSAETTPDEVTWSVGEYVEPEEIWKAFQLPGTPIPKVGVYADQPAPAAATAPRATLWGTWKWLTLALILVAVGLYFGAGRKQVLRQSYNFTQAPVAAGQPMPDQGQLTPQFDVTGGTTNLEVEINTDLRNDWAYFNIALIEVNTGQVREFGKEVSFYSGSDSDGSWSEGEQLEEFAVLDVPAGKYYLRIDPEMDTKEGTHRVQFAITVRRDVPTLSFFWLALVALLIPPIFRSGKGANFERERWAQSDYA